MRRRRDRAILEMFCCFHPSRHGSYRRNSLPRRQRGGSVLAAMVGLLWWLAMVGGGRAAEQPAIPPDWVVYPFNGKDLEGWEVRLGRTQENFWRVGKAEVDPENPRRLVVKPGGSDLVNAVTGHTQGGDLVSKARWSDCRIEIEVMVPKGSNSGIYVMGTEIQVLDGINARTSPKSNMGAIYGVRGPSYFPEKWLHRDWRDKEWLEWQKSEEYLKCVTQVLKPPGEWQKFVIEFELGKHDPATKTAKPACFRRVELNGVVIHENVDLGKGPRPPGSVTLLLQGNHGPVAYRNIKITPLSGGQ